MRPSIALASFFLSKYLVSCQWVDVLGDFHWHQQSRASNFLCHTSRLRLCYRQPPRSPWSLLSEGNQSKSWEKVWANWNCLSLVTSHVVGTSRAEHTTSDMSYKQMRLCHRSSQDNQSKSWTKVWPLFVLSLIASHAVSTSREEQTTSYMSYKQTKTLSSFTIRQPIQILGKGVTSGVVFTGDGVYDT